VPNKEVREGDPALHGPHLNSKRDRLRAAQLSERRVLVKVRV
jgi:hypothetical protein